jgi:hypothetical protein
MLTATLSAMLAADEAEAEARPDTLGNQAPYTADAASAQTSVDGISELTAAPGHAPRTLGAEEALQQIVNNYAAAQPGCIESIAAPLPSAALLPAAALPLPLTSTVPTAPGAENVPEQAEPSSVKRRWTDEEDKQLLQAVALYGAQRWPLIASALSSMREGKQCRERWFNHLCPDVKKGEWTAEEDELMAQAVAELGTKWCEIVKRLPGRSDNAIKNRYNSQLRKSKRRSDASAVAVAAAAAAEQQQQQQQPLDDAVAASRPGAKRRRANAAKADGTVEEEVEQDAAKPKSAGAVVASEGSCASASEAPVPEAPVAVVSAAAAAAASALALCAQVGSMVAVQAAELEADQQEGEEVEEAEQGDDDALSQASDEVVEALEVEATIELEVQAVEVTES